MTYQLTHHYHDRIAVAYDGAPLFDYVYAPQVPAFESPRPYFHPLRTLRGDIVTGFRPHDHRWHHGLSMTFAYLSGQNFWGGNTYVHGQGYIPLENSGQQRHGRWDEVTCDPTAGVTLRQAITWHSYEGEAWIDEARRIAVTEVDVAAGRWALDIGMRLRNIRGAALEFGSPTTQGRDKAGYGGLFWRGPRSFIGGLMTLADGRQALMDEGDLIGERAPWLAFTGRHDGVDHESTLLFIDHPDNPRYPTQWFVRAMGFPGASFALTFDELFILQPGEEVNLQYRIVIADGIWPHEQIKAYLA